MTCHDAFFFRLTLLLLQPDGCMKCMLYFYARGYCYESIYCQLIVIPFVMADGGTAASSEPAN